MTGTRFARTGRCRFMVCLGIVLLVGMVVLFHSSQVQLDETREQRLHCEQQQEALNERLTTLVEQKYHLERNQERERNVQLETKRNFEQKIKDLEQKYQKDQVEQQMLYDKLKQTYTILQSDHKHLKEESQKTNKQQLDNINGLEKNLQSVRSELQKEKSNKSGELIEWKEKYNIAENDIKRLHNLLTSENQLHDRIKELEEIVKDYQDHCKYKAVDNSRKPVAPKPDMNSPRTSEKSFKHQDTVSEGVYHILVNISNNNNKESKNLNGNGATSSNEPSNAHVGVKDKLIQQETTKISSLPLQNPLDTNNDIKPLTAKHFNGSLILNSVENFQIVQKTIKGIADDEQQQQEKPNRQLSAESDKHQVAPLSAPKNNGQLASTTAPKARQQQIKTASSINTTSANVRTARGSSTSSTNSPPLALPPNQRKLPENVAPIPENFEDLLQKSNNENLKSNDNRSQLDKNLTHDLNENKIVKLPTSNNNNYDSGAHEIKDTMAEGDSNNAQHYDDINNFFDNDQDPKERIKNNNKNLNDDKDDDGGNDDDDGGLKADNGAGDSILGGAAVGDIAVKHNHQQLLDDSLRNEIADDQGKEFGDGLRLDEGAMEEDDDDDYSNPSARKQAAGQAIRN